MAVAGLEVEKKEVPYDIGYAFFGVETLRAKPEPRARSARAFEGVARASRAKPEKKRGEGSGEGAREPLPRKFLKIHT